MFRRLLTIAVPVAILLGTGAAQANCTLPSGNVEKTPDGVLTDNFPAPETVTHTTTGLVWKKCPQGRSGTNCTTGTSQKYTWQQALRAAATDTTAGLDWRLPSRNELLSIVETGCADPTINTTRFPVAFPMVPVNHLTWTSTPGPVNAPLRAWAVEFNRGSLILADKAASYYVRLVSGGSTHEAFNRLSVAGFPTNAIAFTAQTGVNTSSLIESNSVSPTGMTGTPTVSIVGGEYSKNGGAYTAVSGPVANNDTLKVRLVSSNLINTKNSATLSINGLAVDFTVTTGATSELNPLSFNSLTDLATNIPITSNFVTVSGLTQARPISVSGGTNPQYSKDGGLTWTGLASTVNNGDLVAVRHTSSTLASTTTTATLDIFGRQHPFTITTRPTTAVEPADIIIPAKVGVPVNTATTSDPVTVTGLSVNRNVTVSTGGSYDINRDNNWRAAGVNTSIPNNTIVRVRRTSAATGSTLTATNLTVNAKNYPFNITTVDVEPTNFSFTERDGAARGTWYSSEEILVEGLTASRAISISGASGQYRLSSDGVNWSAWTSSAGTIAIGQHVQVRLATSTAATTQVTTTLDINGQTFPFRVTTGSQLEMPGPIYFEDVYGARPGGIITSNTETITALADPSAPITVTNGLYRKNGGPFTAAAGTVTAGDTVALGASLLCNAAANTSQTVTATINGFAYPFIVWTGTTAALANNPFSFAEVSNACPSVVVTSQPSPPLCSGYVGAVSIAGGTAPQYAKNGSATWVNTAGTIALNDYVTVRQTASASFNTLTTTNLTLLGPTVVPFRVTTRVSDPIPGSVVIPTATATAGQANVVSEELRFDLCTNRQFSISGSGTPAYNICNDASYPCTAWSTTWNTAATTPVAGRSVRVRLTAGASPSNTTATLTINSVPFTYTVQVP